MKHQNGFIQPGPDDPRRQLFELILKVVVTGLALYGAISLLQDAGI